MRITEEEYLDYVHGKSEEQYQSIKPLLEKIIKVLYRDRQLLFDAVLSNVLNVHNIDAAAGNHLFDDWPECFGIEKLEGFKVREYFQVSDNNYPHRDFIVFLHRDFRGFLEKEDRSHYIESANITRKKAGFRLINPETYEFEY